MEDRRLGYKPNLKGEKRDGPMDRRGDSLQNRRDRLIYDALGVARTIDFHITDDPLAAIKDIAKDLCAKIATLQGFEPPTLTARPEFNESYPLDAMKELK